MITNPSGNIYNKFNNYKRITRDLDNQTKAPTTKGLLSRDMSMKKNMSTPKQDDPFNEAMDFFEAIQNERLKADHYTAKEVNPDEYDPTEPVPSDITKDAESKRLYDRLSREEKLYGRFKRKDEKEA